MDQWTKWGEVDSCPYPSPRRRRRGHRRDEASTRHGRLAAPEDPPRGGLAANQGRPPVNHSLVIRLVYSLDLRRRRWITCDVVLYTHTVRGFIYGQDIRAVRGAFETDETFGGGVNDCGGEWTDEWTNGPMNGPIDQRVCERELGTTPPWMSNRSRSADSHMEIRISSP